jgi:hypothetical protein
MELPDMGVTEGKSVASMRSTARRHFQRFAEAANAANILEVEDLESIVITSHLGKFSSYLLTKCLAYNTHDMYISMVHMMVS